MGLFSRKKKLTKDEQDKLDQAREELKKYKEEELEISRIQREKDLDELTQKEEISEKEQKELDAFNERVELALQKKQEEFNNDIANIQNNISTPPTSHNKTNSMMCSALDCNNKVDFFSGKKCKFCHNTYCFNHIQLEKHECSKTTPVKFLRKSWLRKYDVNISSGQYIVVCDVCGYVSQLGSLIDIAGEERIYHIKADGCDEKRVFLEEDLSHEKVSKDIPLESVVPSDRMFWVCSHCRPPQKFTDRSDYIAHHYSHS